MKRLFLLMTGALAIAVGHAPAAHADEVSLSFDESVASASPDVVTGPSETTSPSETASSTGLLPLPPQTKVPPVQSFSLKNSELPPPPKLEEPVAPEASMAAIAPAPADPPQTPPAVLPQQQDAGLASKASGEAIALQPEPARPSSDPQALSSNGAAPSSSSTPELTFDPPRDAKSSSVELAFERSPAANSVAAHPLDPLFEGGSESLVARTVGSAEGTRTADGLRTRAYFGHVDPGNGVWNLGSFSYQHGARSPEEADDKQLTRLRKQAAILQEQAAAKGIQLTLEEKLNGIDLANQSPRAALDRGGYIDWLAEARNLGLTGEEAVLWSRTRSFLDPDTQQWNAPGLGNNVASISRDQERRLKAIARALQAYRQNSPQITLSDSSTPQDSAKQTPPQPTAQPKDSAALNFLSSRPVSNAIDAAIDKLMNIDLNG